MALRAKISKAYDAQKIYDAKQDALIEIASAFERVLFGHPFTGIPDGAYVPMTDLTLLVLGKAPIITDNNTMNDANDLQNEILADALCVLADRVADGCHLYTRA